MPRHLAALLFASVCFSALRPLYADVLVFKIPVTLGQGTGRGGGPGISPAPQGGGPGGPGMPGGPQDAQVAQLELTLQGRVQVNAGRTVSFVHQSLNQPLYFDLDSVQIKRVPTTQQTFNRMLGKATRDKNADAVFQTAVWALKKGLLKEYFRGVKQTLEIDPAHAAALRISELKKEIDKPLPQSPDEEAAIRRIVKSNRMTVKRSNHFILLHDTPAKPAEGRKKSRADERLALLEQVYESFLLLFDSQGIELDIPKERLQVVLFKEFQDFTSYATSLSPSLSSAAGFWEPTRNISVFYDHGTDEEFLALEKLQKELKTQADESRRNVNAATASTVRLSKTINLLIDVAQENADIEVVSHEATHQMAGNTGLFPRYVMIPSWVHEGLATYFESPGDGAWGGIGAVNAQRLKWYRALENDRQHSNINFIVGDQIFDFAKTNGATLHGYGQAWALTHFLLETHLKEFVAYYRMLGEMPPDAVLNPDLLTQLFDKVFGADRKQLDVEWRAYMRSLKTDLEQIEEDDGKG